jgi:hypothetical protein
MVGQLIKEQLIRDGSGTLHVPDDIAYRAQELEDLERHAAVLRSQLAKDIEA